MTGQSLNVTRIIPFPRDRVWQAWTDPAFIRRWWGPKDFTAPEIRNDLRVGGTYLYCMRGSMGPGVPPQDFWSTGEYREIVPQEKIVATDHFSDEKGNIISPNAVGMPGKWSDEMLVTVMFEDAGTGRTKLTVHHTGHPQEMVKNATMGWNQSLDKLEAVLKE